MIQVNKERTQITHTGDDGLIRIISVTCLIRDHTKNPDAHPEAADGSLYPQFYQPQPFPAGTWHVTEIWPNDNPYTAPFFIGTDAHQTVKCLDGSEVDDHGYGIHHSTSATTWGCLNVPIESDLRWLASLVKVGEQIVVEGDI
jgi:L,D-transpeptidase catalytic domain